MSIIFSHALNAIKAGHSNANIPTISKTAEPKVSVLSRIKKTGVINTPNIMKVAKKTIRKVELPWKHDLYKPSTLNFTVFVRNLSESVDSDVLRESLSNNQLQKLIGIKVEKDTAELNFETEDSAINAVNTLNNLTFDNRKLKAVFNQRGKNSQMNTKENEDKNKSYEKKMKIDEDQKKSILERIRKNK